MDEQMMEIEATVNGVAMSAKVAPRWILSHWLRDHLGLTGTHIGCDTSQCGICTVLIDGQAVKSCTVLAVQTDGSEITTVEGLARDGVLNPVQVGFWERHGLQCGFCTPGAEILVTALLKTISAPGEDQIREALDGLYCRCTGYQNIVAAVQEAARLAAPGEEVHT